MFKNIKIGTKILCMVLFISLLTLLIISAISYTAMLNLVKYSQDASILLGITAAEESKTALLDQAEEDLGKIAAEQAANVNGVFVRVHANVRKMKIFVEELYREPRAFTGKSVPRPEDTRMEVLSAKYQLAPGTALDRAVGEELRRLSSAEYLFSPILRTNPIVFNAYIGTRRGLNYRYSPSNRVSPDYDPRTRPWYKEAMEKPDQVIWTDTYLDNYNAICTTCAVSYRDEQGNNEGVVAVDIRMTAMIQQVLDLRLGKKGYAFLLDHHGQYIAHPQYGKPGFNNNPLEEATGPWKEMLQSLLEGRHGSYRVEMYGTEYQIFSMPVEETGWTLCVCMPVEEIIAPANATKADIDHMTDDALKTIRKSLATVLMQFIIIFAVSAILVIGFSFALSLTIVRPIQELALQVKRIGAGDLESQIEVQGGDEIASLGNAFNKMVQDLRGYIQNLSVVTAEKERLNGDLRVAAKIQEDMLPRTFPEFTSQKRIHLFAKMECARQVGGDFYDFFYINEQETKLAVVIADVSGKGVPAALFMVVAKTLIKTHMLQGMDPAAALERVNNLLCHDNTQTMFVTVFLCLVDLETLEMVYANGGHNPPLFAASGEPYHFLKLQKGIPLGMLEESVYQNSLLRLKAGDKIYLYTDGINEAMNKEGRQFGNNAFLETANLDRDLPPQEFDDAIRKKIAEFAAGAEQWDDITTVAISFV